MLNKFIEKNVLFVLVVVLCLNFVVADDSWDGFDEGDDSSVVLAKNLSNNPIDVGSDVDNFNLGDLFFKNGDSFEYTPYFYIALGVSVVGLLIVVFFIYLFLRRPRNRWKK